MDDSRAPLIDTKHALDSALFDFYSAIEANLAKKGSTPAAHNENPDWLQNQSADYRAGYAHAMRDIVCSNLGKTATSLQTLKV